MLEIAILIISSALSFFIGTSVLIKNPKSSTSILFFLLSVTLIFWSVINYFLIDSNDDSLSLILMNLNFAGVIVQNTLFFLFSSVFPNVKYKFRLSHRLFIGFTIVVLGLLASGFVISGFENGNLVPAPGISLFILHALLSVIGGFRRLYIRHKKQKSKDAGISYLLYSSLILWVLVPVTNFVLPLVFNVSTFVRFSALYVLLFSVLISYAILKQKLFDLRLVVARATGYLFSTTVSIVVYVALAYTFKVLILKEDNLSSEQLASNIILMVLLVLMYPSLKKMFDKITNKLFFRDAYDPQILIDKLNQTLVTNIQLESLLTKSALVLQENIKLDFCTFYIRETSYFPSRIIGAHRRDPEIDHIDDLETLAARLHHRVHYAESEVGSDDEKQLSKVLKSNDIEVLARLVTTLDYDVKGIGYIFFGQKKNGSQYTVQDLKILEIIANELVIAIENALRYEEIEQFNVTLQKKIDDATRELKESNDKLKALDEAKDEFVSMASHQLRTPLTSIKGYISMVLDGDAGKISETQAKMLGQAFFSSQRMVYLISDLLNVSRLKTGKFIIDSKPVYLPDVVESEIKQLIEGANSKNLTLSFTKPKEFATLLLDEMKLRQVIMNFTDNAIYYTASGGKITVGLKETAKSVEFTVKDNGMGVPKEQQHKLFVKFYRADNARKARPDGTGLGLFMAKKVIIAQGGSMIFESTEGKGSTFGFSFPKEKLEVTSVESEK